MILHGKHLIKAWTKQQSIVAISSAEAELYAGKKVDVSSGVCHKTWVEPSRFGRTPVRHCL